MTITIQITAVSVGERLPDADTNVLLLLSDGNSCEGFLDYEGIDGLVWRDVCADPLDVGVVTHWADMPAREGAWAYKPRPLVTRLRAARALMRDWRKGFYDAEKQHGQEQLFTPAAEHEVARFDEALQALTDAIKAAKGDA